MTTKADIIKKDPWYVLPILSNRYFNKKVKPASDKLDEQLAENTGSVINTLWANFRKNPYELPVYTKGQFDRMLQGRELTQREQEALNKYITRHPETIFSTARIFSVGRQFVDNALSAVRRVASFIKKEANIFSITLQTAHEYIANNFWDKINPANGFFAWLFSRFNWMQRRIAAKRQKLIDLSPFYRAKIENKTIDQISRENKEYCLEFGIENEEVARLEREERERVARETGRREQEERDIIKARELQERLATENRELDAQVAQLRLERQQREREVREMQVRFEKEQKEREDGETQARLAVRLVKEASDREAREAQERLERESHLAVSEPEKKAEEPISPLPEKKPAGLYLQLNPANIPPRQDPYVQKMIVAPVTTVFEWDQSKISLSKFAKETLSEHNKNVYSQLTRDVDLMQKTLQSPGSEEYHGSLSVSILKKIFFTFNKVDPLYKRDGNWQRFSKSNIPLASVLTHTVRTLIQLPPIGDDGVDYASQFFTQFLGLTAQHKRAAATHGIAIMPQPEFVGDEKIYKHVVETKPGKIQSGLDYVYSGIYDRLYGTSLEGHYGINLSFGGDKNKHFLSGREINNKGEFGHLYLYFKPATTTTPGAILIGIEQSAPSDKAAPEVQSYFGSVHDQVGGGHDILGTPSLFTVSGGDHFGKSPQSMGGLGPDCYYDSMFTQLSIAQCALIQEQFNEEQFDLSIVGCRPRGDEALTGHDQMDEIFRQNALKLSAEQSSLLNYLFYRPQIDDVEDNQFDFQWHLDIVAGKRLKGISSIDEGYRISVLQKAMTKLREYLQQQGKSPENKGMIQNLIEEVSKANTWSDVVQLINRIENFKIDMSGSRKSVKELLDSKRTLPHDLAIAESFDFQGGDLALTIFAPVSDWIFSTPHFNDFVCAAHQILMDLVPVNRIKLMSQDIQRSVEINLWRDAVIQIANGQETKALRDFTRDFAINGISGKERMEIIKGDELSSPRDKEGMLRDDIIKCIEAVCVPGIDRDAKIKFMLSSGGQDMTRFVEEMIHNHLEVDGAANRQFRIANSEQHGNWYLDDQNNTCFNAKVYVTSLLDPSDFNYLVKGSDSLMLVEASEKLQIDNKNHALPKLFEVEVQVRLRTENEGFGDYTAIPEVTQCDFSFYSDKIKLRPALSPALEHSFEVMI